MFFHYKLSTNDFMVLITLFEYLNKDFKFEVRLAQIKFISFKQCYGISITTKNWLKTFSLYVNLIGITVLPLNCDKPL